MADSKDWSSNANDVLQIRLRHSTKDSAVKDVAFEPAFTYPVFGDEETIFGYQGLRIRLDFTADTLQPSLSITSTAQFEPLDDTKADDIEGALREVLPGLDPSAQPKSNGAPSDPALWKPPGELLHQYEVDGRSYGVWSASMTEPGVKDLFRNMQALVLFFIEGGTLIELDDPDWTMDRWRVFLVYAIHSPPSNPNPSTYSLVGYCTAYTLFFLDEAVGSPAPDFEFEPDDTSLQKKLPSRSRISQFLILPPYQHAGHGSRLYDTIFNHFLAAPNTLEIPIEDPNESFDDLRDQNDLIRLRATTPSFNTLRINASATLGPRTEKLPTSSLLPIATTQPIHKSSKIAPRQFSRLVEMQLLSRIPPLNRQVSRTTRKDKASDENDRAYYFWRLLVKQRLYKHNRDQLIQLDLDERLEKLDETLQVVERDYLRLLDAADRRIRRMGALETIKETKAGPNGTSGVTTPRRGVKRRVVDDDEDEDEKAAEPQTNGNPGKRARVEASS